MRRRLEQLRALAPWERRLLARLVLLLPAIGAALHLLGFKWTRDLLARLAPPPADQDHLAAVPTADEAQRIARLVAIAANHGPYRATCLRQSLALWWLLRHRGVRPELRIGVRKDQGELQAHAWVEHDGLPLGQGHQGHAPFPILTASADSLGATRSRPIASPDAPSCPGRTMLDSVAERQKGLALQSTWVSPA